MTSLSGHTGPVKAVSWATSSSKSPFTFLSASHDQSVLVWHLNKDKTSVTRSEKCVGHTESVECIDVNNSNSKVSKLMK